MSWVKLCDGFPGHVKVRGLSDAAFRLHVTALCDCAAHLTDGRVTSAAARTLPGSPQGARLKKTVAELVAVGLWEEADEDGWLIHDFLEWNPSGECVRANRVAARERMNRVRSPSVRANTERTQSEPTPNEQRSSCDRATRVPSRPVPVPRSEEPPIAPQGGRTGEPDGRSPPERGGPMPAAAPVAVRRVFEAWKLDTGKHRAVLDRKRAKRIEARLRELPEQDLLDALEGRRSDDWLMGRDPKSSRVYDDIETLFRDAAQVERLRDLAHQQRGDRSPQSPVPPHIIEALEADRRKMRAESEELARRRGESTGGAAPSLDFAALAAVKRAQPRRVEP